MTFNPWQEFDDYADGHPELEVSEAFARWLASKTGEPVVGRELDGDGLVVAIPEEA